MLKGLKPVDSSRMYFINPSHVIWVKETTDGCVELKLTDGYLLVVTETLIEVLSIMS